MKDIAETETDDQIVVREEVLEMQALEVAQLELMERNQSRALKICRILKTL